MLIRIGFNDGPVFVVNDIQGNQNVWGPGIILARRIMDIGDEMHILMSQKMAETLRELSDEYKIWIHLLHDFPIKYGRTILVYSVYGNRVGNRKSPKNPDQRSKMAEELAKRRATTIYNNIDVTLTITDPRSMLAHHKRIYDIECISDDPLEAVLHGISTDVPKSFNDFNIKTSDEGGELKIMSINFDTEYQTEFTTAFNTPAIRERRIESIH